MRPCTTAMCGGKAWAHDYITGVFSVLAKPRPRMAANADEVKTHTSIPAHKKSALAARCIAGPCPMDSNAASRKNPPNISPQAPDKTDNMPLRTLSVTANLK